MKLFVTGGAGFIGSNFVRMALGGRLPGLENADITVFDALTYSGTLTNLETVADHSRFTFVKGDIRDAASRRGSTLRSRRDRAFRGRKATSIAV